MAVTTETLRERDLEEARKKLEDLRSKRADIDTQIEQAELLIQAWANFQDTLAGKFKLPVAHDPLPAPKRTHTPSRAPRGAREELKGKILDLLEQHPEGLKANQIADALPEWKKQLPNVLSILKNEERKIDQPAKREPYKIAPPKKESEEAA